MTLTSWARCPLVPVGTAPNATFRVAEPVEPESRQACTVSTPEWPTNPDATSTPLKPEEAATVRPAESNTARSQSPPAAFSWAPTMPLMGAVTCRDTTPLAGDRGRSKHCLYAEAPVETVVDSRSCAPAAGVNVHIAAKTSPRTTVRIGCRQNAGIGLLEDETGKWGRRAADPAHATLPNYGRKLPAGQRK